MSKLKNILPTKLIHIAVVVYQTVFVVYAILILVSSALSPELIETREFLYLAFIILLFGVPLSIQLNITEDGQLTKLDKLSIDFMYRTTIFFTVFSAILWFFNPEQPHLEPLTYILTLVSAWITYQRNSDKVNQPQNLSTSE